MDSLLVMLPLLPFAFVGSFTPGPNNILVMSHGISHGLKATLPYQLGAGAACFIIIGGIVLLGAQLEKVLPLLLEFMKYAGCVYMLWLAWVVGTAAAPGTAADMDAEAPRQCAVTYRSGFFLQFVNPKFYLYTLTLAAVLAPAVHNALDVSLYGFVFSAIAVAGMWVWAAAGALLQNFLRRWYRATNTVMALALVWCAVSLF